MKLPPPPHGWSVSPREAVRLQSVLAPRVREEPLRGAVRFVCGLDAAYVRAARLAVAAAVTWDAERARVVEVRTARRALSFPYVPGLLSFREVPVLLAALRRLRHPPDVLLCDAHGRAHPRRFGLACHVGLVAGLPSIGCAKSVLVGEFTPPPPDRGARSPIVDRGEVIGLALRTRSGVRPVYVSVGHRVDLPSAAAVVLRCAPRYRIPEPIRLADARVRELARGQ